MGTSPRMSTAITHDDVTPPAAPDHQCINAGCGCNDLVSAGPCSEWCSAHTVELADLNKNRAALEACNCGHATCVNAAAALVGTPQRGMS